MFWFIRETNKLLKLEIFEKKKIIIILKNWNREKKTEINQFHFYSYELYFIIKT